MDVAASAAVTTVAVDDCGSGASTGGARIEAEAAAVLRSGALRLLSAVWLLQQPEGFVLKRRQDLPEEAFLQPELAAGLVVEPVSGRKAPTSSPEAGLCPRQRVPERLLPRIVVLSYGWLTKRHPDPIAFHMRRVRQYLGLHLQEYVWQGLEAREELDLGVFWDFGSLPQPDERGCKSDEDAATFKAGLGAINLLYGSRESTLVLQLKGTPAPAELAAAGAPPSLTPYGERGWCIFEQAVASIAKRPELVVDWQRLQLAPARVASHRPRILIPGHLTEMIGRENDERPIREAAFLRRDLTPGPLTEMIGRENDERPIREAAFQRRHGLHATSTLAGFAKAVEKESHGLVSAEPDMGTPLMLLRAACSQERAPPAHPDELDAVLRRAVFTNGKTDEELVARKYRAFFMRVTEQEAELDFSAVDIPPVFFGFYSGFNRRDFTISWDKRQFAVFARALPAFTACRALRMTGHNVSDEGAALLAKALACMPALESVDFGTGQDRGSATPTAVSKKGAAMLLRVLKSRPGLAMQLHDDSDDGKQR